MDYNNIVDPEMSEDYTVYCDSNRLEEFLRERGVQLQEDEAQEEYLTTQQVEPQDIITRRQKVHHQRAGHGRRAKNKSVSTDKYDVNDFEGELCILYPGSHYFTILRIFFFIFIFFIFLWLRLWWSSNVFYW